MSHTTGHRPEHPAHARQRARPHTMHHRSRYRLSFPPFAIVTACGAVLAAIWLGPLGELLERTSETLPRAVIVACILVPLAFAGWYLFSYADVRRNRLTVRSTFHASRIDLRQLVRAEVFAKPTPGVMAFVLGQGGGVTEKRRRHELMLLLTDEEGRQVLLPLNAWRGEELLMARVLRATIERRVRIDGEPLLVRRFSGLLDSYRSWDRQQVAA